MISRKKFLQSSILASLGIAINKGSLSFEKIYSPVFDSPVVVSTWDWGLEANKTAWKILSNGGRALDAVEAGAMAIESTKNCCVGLGAYPDRDGFVTLDASIMDEKFNCGSVAFLERISHPVSVARRVMEKTPHIMLVGTGAREFAIAEGFPLEEQKLSDDAKKNYEEWLKKSGYKPMSDKENSNSPEPLIPSRFNNGKINHDTIGMVAMDAKGNLCGSCTTSGLAFKMHGRVGDSPIIGAGLFVDNEVGAATATGKGEEAIRICGSHTVVEYMRQGLSPEESCKKAIERIIKIKGDEAKKFQLAFLALNKEGVVGAFSIQPEFTYAIRNNNNEKLVTSRSWF